jgi:YbbR domain-containing protein
MRLPGFLTRNLRLKALASGLALVTWVGVVYAGNPPESRTVSVHVPQDPASLPAKYVLATPIPDIALRVSGTRDHVNAFDPSTLQVSVDYRHIGHTGTQDLPLHVVNTDSNVSIDNVPSTVTADIDVNDSVTLPVELVYDQPPPTGYVKTEETVDPSTVVVSGPHRRLSGITAEVHLDLANKKTNIEGQYNVILYDRFRRKVGDLGVQPAQVTIKVTVSSVTTSRASAVVPKVSGTVLAGHQLVSLSVSPPTVVLTGPQELLNGLDSIPTQAISITGLFGDHTFQVKITPPPGVTAQPDTVTVTLSIIALPAATPTPTASPTASPTPSPTSSTPTPTP